VKSEYFMVDRSREQRYDWLKRKRFGFANVIRHYRNSKNKNHTYIMRRKIIMPLVTSKEMLLKAQKGGYAVGAFNAENMEMVKAIIQAAEELKAPVMIQTTPSTVKYGTVETYAAIVAAEAAKASVPVCLHLDHGSSFELAMQAMHAGYTSVMIDGSKLDFEANIAETKRVADVAKALDIPCEAELGKVGGKEDDLEAEADTNTDPQEAKEFVERTGVTSLAVAIGTAHGFYVGTPVLDKERLSEIREVVDIPLVLHGASGLSDEDVMDCVKRGICKVNFATELRAAYSKAVKELLAEKPDTIDPKAYGKTAIAAVKELVMARMKVCGCDGKAE
jgi:tagatose 1,6-diphosphate aldolase GatY/KbaY